MRKPLLILLAAVPLSCLLAGLVYNLPPVHSRLAWRVANLRTQVRHLINPPEEAVFVPQGEAATPVEQAAATATATLPPTATPTQPGPTNTPEPTATATPPPTPIPAQAALTGIRHEYQQMNNCGPATLAMGLSYWGWQGDQRDTRAYLRPNHAEVDDKNVGPDEMVDFVQTQTGLRAITRVGGTVDLLKRLVAAGFPAIIEKGFQPAKEDWMGHYELVNGYDDGRARFITQDAYIMADFPLPYDELSVRWWRDFNYVYVVAYPPEREAELLALLGPDADPVANQRAAAERALQEAQTLTGRDQFFAWYNRGSSLAALQDYAGAAEAYDMAFSLYSRLEQGERPWRLLWYQTGPYAAYYYAGRFQDVVNLAGQTLAYLDKPILEESLYWRGLARLALGDKEAAAADLQRAYAINPTSTQAGAHLAALGIQP